MSLLNRKTGPYNFWIQAYLSFNLRKFIATLFKCSWKNVKLSTRPEITNLRFLWLYMLLFHAGHYPPYFCSSPAFLPTCRVLCAWSQSPGWSYPKSFQYCNLCNQTGLSQCSSSQTFHWKTAEHGFVAHSVKTNIPLCFKHLVRVDWSANRATTCRANWANNIKQLLPKVATAKC